MNNQKNKIVGGNNTGEPFPDEEESAHPGSGREKTISSDAGTEDTRTRQFSRDQVKGGLMDESRSQEGTSIRPDEHEVFSFRRVKKESPYRPLLIILGIMLLIFFGLFVYQMIRSHQNTLVLKKATEMKYRQEGDSGFLKSLGSSPTRPIPEPEVKTYVFTDEIFQGEASRPGEDRPIHFSQQKDAELAALADALNIRARILFGIKVSRKEDTITEICSGDFYGFRISSLMVRQHGEAVRDEISVSTPSRGMFKVSGKFMESFSRTDPELVMRDLEDAGIKSAVITLPDNNTVRVQLRISAHPDIRAGDVNLIDGSGLGKIVLGSDISGLEAQLIPGYGIIKRRIMVENEFVIIYKIEDHRRTPLLYVYEQDGKIWGIEIVDERFKTDRGLGIGSSLGAMRIIYTGVSIVSIPGKVTYLWIDQENLKMIKFILVDDRRIDFDSENFPFDIRINSILIGNSPYLK